MTITATFELEFSKELVKRALDNDREAWDEMVAIFTEGLLFESTKDEEGWHKYNVDEIRENTCIRNYNFCINKKPELIFEM